MQLNSTPCVMPAPDIQHISHQAIDSRSKRTRNPRNGAMLSDTNGTTRSVDYQKVQCGTGTLFFPQSQSVKATPAAHRPHAIDTSARTPYIRFAISSSITSVAPPPIDCTRASRAMRSIAASRM